MYYAVPPHLHTGANFGCTSFCVTLFHLMKKGRLTGVCCTDSQHPRHHRADAAGLQSQSHHD